MVAYLEMARSRSSSRCRGRSLTSRNAAHVIAATSSRRWPVSIFDLYGALYCAFRWAAEACLTCALDLPDKSR